MCPQFSYRTTPSVVPGRGLQGGLNARGDPHPPIFLKITFTFLFKITFTFTQWFRDEVSKEDSMPEETLTLLFSHIDPLYELHASFLKVVLLSLSFPLPSQLPMLLPHILCHCNLHCHCHWHCYHHCHCYCHCQLFLRIPTNFSLTRKP